MLEYLWHKEIRRKRLAGILKLDPVTPRSIKNTQFDLAVLPEEHQWLCNFNERLPQVDGNSRLLKIDSVERLQELLTFYYSLDNPLIPLASAFPFLHGLHNLRQRLFFESLASPQQVVQLASHAHYVEQPQMNHHSHFSLMVVEAEKSAVPKVVNSAPLDDILTSKGSQPDDEDGHFEYAEYEPFNLPTVPQNDGINNRNLAGQVKIGTYFSHFLVYTNNMDWDANLKAATAILSLAKTDKVVYIVDFPPEDWDQLGDPFLNETPETKHPKLLQWEQTSVWKLNSIKWAYPGICLGTTTDFSYLSRSSNHNFKVFVNCHDKALFPNPKSLDKAYAEIQGPRECNPLYIEFPGSGLIQPGSLSEDGVVSMLKLLQLLRYFIQVKKQDVFVFCYDGFSGLSTLTIALGLFRSDNCECVEDVMLSLMGKVDKLCFSRDELRLYFYRSDLEFLKHINHYIQAAKSVDVDSKKLISAIPKPKMKLPDPQSGDWFKPKKDNNFPSKIIDNLYLGSLAQASSLTVLRSLGIRKIVSMGEKTSWLDQLGVKFDFEEHEPGTETIAPIFQYDGSSVYVVNIENRIAEYPELETVVYVHKVHDDGRDSIWPLLVGPQTVQDAVLGPEPSQSPTTLVHCRIGVSRSASVVIATLMKYHHMSFISAYMHVRVRRLNIIIQPNLRFLYELFLYEQHLQHPRADCWWTLCHEIDRLNRHYIT